MEKADRLSGGMLVFLGAFLWSLNAPLVKWITLDGILVCGMRSVIAAAVLLPFVRPGELNWNRWTLLYVASYGALSLSVIRALEMTDSAIAIGMQYTSVLWLWLFSLGKGKRITWKESIPVLLVIAGVTLFMAAGSDGGRLKGNLIALGEGIFFLGMTVSSPRAAKGNPIGLTAVANLATGIFVFLFLRPDVTELAAGPGLNWLLLFILGALQVGGGYGLYNMGLQRVSARRASMLALWEMILGPVWVAAFLGEYPAGGVAAGLVIIVAGLFLDSLWGSQKEKGGEKDHAGH